ncbi:hypothetical protein GS429_12140 [Natronorubrum sp. JWXQ-INN-674]|uniref:Uncharacterized protein n=1 Tax=Natronorubrum halalkaliphilum TaxID=2691917 RepID=A0A6B0VPU9_9EURY|nr:hypothetical protein [Natronorubrum halalkaliphilum]MXV62802.1 hypothetical protein [Natronorubrum halalkaliphilum]
MAIDEILRDAERKQRRELEQMAKTATELRARIPTLVEKSIKKDRERIAVELAERSDLSHREIAEIVDQSPA